MTELSTRYYVYWDHENCPTPRESSIHDVIEILKEKIIIAEKIQSLEFHSIKFYNNNGKNKLSPKIMSELDQFSHINCPTVHNKKNESVDKKIIADIGYDLWDCKGSHMIKIVLISGDSDYTYLLSKIKNGMRMAETILVPKFRSKNVKSTLINCCDIVIDLLCVDKDKNKYALTLCKNGSNDPSTRHLKTCRYYHKKVQQVISTSTPTPKPTHMSYRQLLDNKLDISKESIIYLTKQAQIDLHRSATLAGSDCGSIVNYFFQLDKSKEIKDSSFLAVIYLIDSISQSVGGVFIKLFETSILNIMRSSYQFYAAINNNSNNQSDELVALREVLRKWIRTKIFDQHVLNQISHAFSETGNSQNTESKDEKDEDKEEKDENDEEDKEEEDKEKEDENKDKDKHKKGEDKKPKSAQTVERILCPKCGKKSYTKKNKWYRDHVKKCKGK